MNNSITFFMLIFLFPSGLKAQSNAEIDGTLKIGESSLSILEPEDAGTMRYNDSLRNFQGWTGIEWVDLSTPCNINDYTPPTPNCFSSISYDLNSNSKVTVFASDFNAGSTDNCNIGSIQFIIGYNPSTQTNLYRKSKTFDCNKVGTNTVEVYFEDLSGNRDYCVVTIYIDDNDNCGH